MFALETQLAPDPMGLAERLWRQPGAVFLWSADQSGPSYLGCLPCEVHHGPDPEPELALVGARCLGRWGQVPRWVGFLPYEAERARMERPRFSILEHRPLPHHTQPTWWRYPAMVVVNERVTIVADDRQRAKALLELLKVPPPKPDPIHLEALDNAEPEAEHERRVRQALEWIKEGEIYQVNVARRLDFKCQGSSLELLRRMSALSCAPYCCAFKDAGVISTSPELFLRTSAQGRVLTRPIKGTRPRGDDAISDREQCRQLERDEKEIAELAMVIDIERSDLARVGRVGSVCALPPQIHTHRRVFHREALVSAQLAPGVSRTQLLQATLPSGSITGAPKVRAMELIAQLELQRRGLYTGALGAVAQDGTLNLAMAIRTVTRHDDDAHYFVGGGIVADSQPEREVQETWWKSVQITRLLAR